jgi:hypothetical protein
MCFWECPEIEQSRIPIPHDIVRKESISLRLVAGIHSDHPCACVCMPVCVSVCDVCMSMHVCMPKHVCRTESVQV